MPVRGAEIRRAPSRSRTRCRRWRPSAVASGGQVDVDARAEADESVALPARQRGAGFHVAEDSPRDEPRHLDAGDVAAPGGAQMQRVALVLERRLVERGVEEAAGVVPRGHDHSVDGTAVRMHVEHVHEHADLERVAVEIRIARLPDADDPAVGRGEHGVGIARNGPRRIAKELDDEQHHQPGEPRGKPQAGPRQAPPRRRAPARGTASPRAR